MHFLLSGSCYFELVQVRCIILVVSTKAKFPLFFSQVSKPIFVSKIPKGKLPFRGRVPTTCASSPIIISSLGLHSLVKYSVSTFTSKTLFLLILPKKVETGCVLICPPHRLNICDKIIFCTLSTWRNVSSAK